MQKDPRRTDGGGAVLMCAFVSALFQASPGSFLSFLSHILGRWLEIRSFKTMGQQFLTVFANLTRGQLLSLAEQVKYDNKNTENVGEVGFSERSGGQDFSSLLFCPVRRPSLTEYCSPGKQSQKRVRGCCCCCHL